MTNKTMGFITSDQDRSVFQKRADLLSLCHVNTRSIVADFEMFFVGNNVNGYSFAKILESFLINLKGLVGNRNIDLSYWFNADAFKTVFFDKSGNFLTMLPSDFKLLFENDARYKGLIRTDLKLAPFNYILPTSNSFMFTTVKPMLPNFVTMTNAQLNEWINIFQDAVTIITFLESENSAINIEGNYDGLKTNGFESLLNDQLDFLNNINDKVQTSLIDIKLKGQNDKDNLLLLIEAKKTELNNSIIEKRRNIFKMTSRQSVFNSLIK